MLFLLQSKVQYNKPTPMYKRPIKRKIEPNDDEEILLAWFTLMARYYDR